MPSYKGEYEWALKPFTDAMRVKLAMNKHKDRGDGWESVDLSQIFAGLKKEVAELEEALIRRNTTEILLECADIANFAMIVANVATREAVRGVGSDWTVPDKVAVIVAPSTGQIKCLCGYVGDPEYKQETVGGIEYIRRECPSCHRSHDHA